MTFMWGFQDSANNTHTSEMLGFEFESNSAPYSIDNLVESVGVFIFDIIEAFVSGRKGFMIYNLIVGILGVLMNACTLLFKFKPHHTELKKKQLQIENSKSKVNDDTCEIVVDNSPVKYN
jgi:hypothetical protein